MNEAVSKTIGAFKLGAIIVEPSRNLVRNAEQSFALEPRIMDVLCLLAKHDGEVVSRDTLIEDIWQIEYGGDDSLTRAISLLRKTFREAGEPVNIIETIPKRGYRLALPIADIAHIESGPSVKTARSEEWSDDRRKTDGMPQKRWRFAALTLALLAMCAAGFVYLTTPIEDAPEQEITVSTTVETPPRSLAVLPFADLSESGDQAYFSDGVSEEILNVMTRLEGLSVAGRTSSFAFKDRNTDLRDIGETLNVAYILEGSVKRQDDQVRIIARLIEARDGYHLWSETYDRDLDDIFAVQDDIARAIARELDILLIGPEDEPISPPLTNSGEALDLVLRARALYRQEPTPASFDEAERFILRALEIDPNYADAWISLATLNNFASGYVGARSPKVGFEASRNAISEATKIDPEGARTLIWRANINHYEGNLTEAYEVALKSLELEPENASIVFSIGHYNAIYGYTKRALPYLETATRLDPLDGFAWHIRALVSQNLGNYQESEIQAKRAVELGDLSAIDTRIWNALSRDEIDIAFTLFEQLFEVAAREADDNLGARALWGSLGRAMIEGSEVDKMVMQTLLRQQFADDGFEPSAVSLGAAARLQMYDEVFSDWRDAYATKSLIAVAIWGDFEWARNMRQSEGFKSFAEKEGFIALWQKHGWPDICRPEAGTDGSSGQFTCD